MALTGIDPALSKITGTVHDVTSIANAIVVTAQGVNKWDLLDQGAGGKSLLFSQRGEDSIELSSEIPDHFTEANESLQDDIAKRPEQVTVRGFVGELTDALPGAISAFQTLQTQLSTFNPYQPALAIQALSAYNNAQQLLQAAAAAVQVSKQAFALIKGDPVENAQTQAFRYLQTRWDSRCLFNVMTPWGLFKDMAILTMRAVQDEDTQEVSEFSCTFKRMRFASSELEQNTVLQGRRAAQGASVVDHGPQSPPFVGPLLPTEVGGLAT